MDKKSQGNEITSSQVCGWKSVHTKEITIHQVRSVDENQSIPRKLPYIKSGLWMKISPYQGNYHTSSQVCGWKSVHTKEITIHQVRFVDENQSIPRKLPYIKSGLWMKISPVQGNDNTSSQVCGWKSVQSKEMTIHQVRFVDENQSMNMNIHFNTLGNHFLKLLKKQIKKILPRVRLNLDSSKREQVNNVTGQQR
jgi:hypothetical protein